MRNRLPLDSTMLWFDMVVKCQHMVSTVSTEELQELFGASLRGIGRAVCVLMPWNKPTYVERIWCQFELHTILEQGLEYEMALPPQQQAAFEEHIATSGGSGQEIVKFLSDVDVGSARAREEGDRLAILAVVDAGVGRDEMNSAVRRVLRGWMMEAARVIEGRLLRRMGAGAGDSVRALASLSSLGSVHFDQVSSWYCGYCLVV